MISRALSASLLAASLAFSVSAFAEEGFSVKPGQSTKGVLDKQNGATVTVQLKSGKELTGKVALVGERVLHLSNLSGRDFYDAVIELSEIEAVIVKARSK
jgi:hypothetical protein